MKPAIVSASFERCKSGSIPFEVYLRSPISPTNIIDSFLRRAINNRHLWKRFAHDWTFNYYPRAKEMTANTHLLHRKIHAPQLSQIIIGFPYAIQAADNREVLKMLPKMHYYSSWSTPNLRFMKTTQMIPVPFSGSNTLTTLSIYQCLSRGTCFDLTSLMSFLASCPVLTEFMLKVHDSDRVHESYRQQLPPEHRMETKSVERLTLMFEWGDSSTIGDLINAIRFPSVSVAIFLINAEFGTQGHRCIQAMFPVSEDVFPNLSQLHLTVKFGYGKECREPMPTPFLFLPKLEHLTLTLHWRECTLLSLPEGTLLPALRSLKFRQCYDLDLEWIANLLRNLKARDSLRESLVVTIDKFPLHDVMRAINNTHKVSTLTARDEIMQLLSST